MAYLNLSNWSNFENTNKKSSVIFSFLQKDNSKLFSKFVIEFFSV